MVLENQVRTVGQLDLADIKSLLFDVLHLVIESDGIDHDTVADDAFDSGTENSGRNEVENVTFVTDLNGVTGIVSALETDDHIDILGQNVNEFTFAFIAPLGTDKHIYCHNKSSLYNVIKTNCKN